MTTAFVVEQKKKGPIIMQNPEMLKQEGMIGKGISFLKKRQGLVKVHCLQPRYVTIYYN